MISRVLIPHDRKRRRRTSDDARPDFHQVQRVATTPKLALGGDSRSNFWKGLAAAFCGLVLLGMTACNQPSDTAQTPARSALPDLAPTKVKAEAGDSEAENALGEIYAEGKQVRGDYAEAVKWYRKAAEKGFAKAQYNLGVLYEIGQSVPLDEAEAARWYLKAAEQGLADAQYNIAGMYGLGRGVARNPKEALRYYNLAAAQGDALSRYNLAERYERAKDVPQDLVEAYKWHTLAADAGFTEGAAERKTLEKQLNAQQRAEARKRVDEYRANHPLPKP